MLKSLADLISVRSRTTRVCCFHFGRCGSTLLGNMLAGHPDIDWQGEVFHAFHERENREQTIEPFSVIEGLLSDSEFKHFGFETKFQHLNRNGLNLDFESYVSKLRQLGFEKFMVIKRRNYLRQAISVARGQATGSWHVSSKSRKPKFQPIHLDVEKISLGGKKRSLLDCFELLDQTYEEMGCIFKRLGVDHFTVHYEDDLEVDPIRGFQMTLSHLGLRFVPPEISVRKLESRSVPEIISNLSEIQDCLSGSGFEWMSRDHA